MTGQKASLFKDFLRRLVKSWSAKLGLYLFIAILLACFIGPLFCKYGKDDIDLTAILCTPCAEHPFGCDTMGRDLLVRIFYGGQYSIILGIVAAVVGNIFGVIIGLVAGYFGGTLENVIMRIMDVWSALPGMMLCILVSAVMGSGFFATVIALTVGGVPGGTRMQRGMTLAERNREYIEAAESINSSKFAILFRHLLPNTIQPTIVMTTMSIGGTIGMAASLSYIGLGIQPPNAEWGAMLSDGKAYIRNYPHLITVPGIAIGLTVLALNLLGDGLRDALDPKLRD